jgi:hypothetical protein
LIESPPIDQLLNRQDIPRMFNSTNRPTVLKAVVTTSFIAALAFSPLALAEEQHEHPPATGSGAASSKDKLDAGATKTVTGEIVDMMCFVDHNASGDKHAACAAKCIKGGGPVGISSEGKTYLVVGEHKPMNDQLAEYAGKTITLKGKLAEREGVAMLENAEIVKK